MFKKNILKDTMNYEPCTRNQTINQTMIKTMNKTMNRTMIMNHEPNH